MLNITTTYSANASGATIIVAKGHGKQRTVRSNPAMSADENHGAAAGALLNVLTDERQQAMLRHPSGKQRVTVESLSEYGGKRRWTINV